MLAASFAFNPWSEKIFMAFPTPPVTTDRSVAVPAARSIAGAIMSAAWAASKPCLAKFSAASAASCMPYTELAAADLIALSRPFASAALAPIVCCTSFRDLSTLPNSVAEAAARPTSGIVTAAVAFVPRLEIPLPNFSTLFQAFCAFLVPAVSVSIVFLKEDVKLSIRLNRTSTSFLATGSPPYRLCFATMLLIFSLISSGYFS